MALLNETDPASARTSLGGLSHQVSGGIIGLRSLSGPDLAGVTMISHRTTPFDGLGGFYIWNAADTTPDNGTTVIAPYLGPATGRWNTLVQASQAGEAVANGQATLIAGTGATVTNAAVTAQSIVIVTGIGSTNAGLLSVTLSAGSFLIQSANALDARAIMWVLYNQI